MIVLPAADRIAVPWKNGGGVTREVAAYPVGAGMEDFGWRVSIADVAAAGPFSRFDGADRILTVLEGRLRFEFARGPKAVELGAGEQHAFAGEAAVNGIPIGNSVKDLNIMFQRASWRAQIGPYRTGFASADVRIAVARQTCGALEPLDALLLDRGEEAPAGFAGYLIILARAEIC